MKFLGVTSPKGWGQQHQPQVQKYRLFAPLLVSRGRQHMIHPEGLHFRFDQIHMQGLSTQMLSVYRTENVLPRNLEICRSEKHNVSWTRSSTKTQKHKNTNHFWLVEKKHPPAEVVSHQGFPHCKSVILCLVRYVFPASTSAQIHTGSMNSMLCKNSSDPY